MKKLALPLLVLLALLCSCAAGKQWPQSAEGAAYECLELGRSFASADQSDIQAQLAAFETAGKCAADGENRFQMVNSSQITDYVSGKSDTLELYVLFGGGFTRYDFSGGELSLVRMVYQNGQPSTSQVSQYGLLDAKLTEKGSFIFTMDIPANPSSKYAHDGYVVPSVLLKTVAPDPELVALCEKYAAPLGFARCNLLSGSWSQGNCSAIDIGDAYDRLFFLSTGENLWDESSGVTVDEFTGEVHIPAESFISLLTRYLPLSREELEGRAEYDAQAGEFVFCIDAGQSFIDTPHPECEVVKSAENPDGSLTLTVDEVFVDMASDCLCRCELTVLPQEDGALRYISNRVIK